MPPAHPIDYAPYLAHEDAGVRGRAWAWQSAMGLQSVEGHYPSAYLAETACQHIAGNITMELVGKLVELYYLSRVDAESAAADRGILALARMLGEKHEASPKPAPRPTSPPPVPAPPAVAPETAAALHNRQKRLLRTLGVQSLSVPELLHALKLNSRQSFVRVWLSPAMEIGLVKALHPESPRHPQQQYLLTRKGQRFLKQLIRK